MAKTGHLATKAGGEKKRNGIVSVTISSAKICGVAGNGTRPN